MFGSLSAFRVNHWYPLGEGHERLVSRGMRFHAERAESLGSISVSWVVVDEHYRVHLEGSAYLASLRGRRRSINTERVYAGRVALYLTWCGERGLAWADPGFENLLRFQRWLVDEPLPTRGKRPRSKPRFRSESSADGVLSTMTQFLTFAVSRGWTPAALGASLVQQKHLWSPPAGYSGGEDGRF